MSVRAAEIAAWQTIHEVVMDHLTSRRAEVVEQLGMSFIKAKALRRLTSRPLTMGELTAALSTDAPYTSVVIDDLVARGLVVRMAHPDDRRRKVVGLTSEGSRYAALADAILDRPPVGFAAMTAAELVMLSDLFGRVGAASAVTAD